MLEDCLLSLERQIQYRDLLVGLSARARIRRRWRRYSSRQLFLGRNQLGARVQRLQPHRCEGATPDIFIAPVDDWRQPLSSAVS